MGVGVEAGGEEGKNRQEMKGELLVSPLALK